MKELKTDQIPINSTDEFLKGMRDCNKGVCHKSGMGSDYDRGYSCQYQHEQNMTAIFGDKHG